MIIRLTDAEREEIRQLHRAFPYIWSIGGLADWYGVCRKTIRRILSEGRA